MSRLSRLIPVLVLSILCSAPALPLWAASAAPASSSSATPVGPAVVLDGMLTRFANEMIPLVQAMPADKFDFAPSQGQFQGVRTFAQQVVHVAQANDHYFGSISTLAPPQIPNAASLKTKAQVLQVLQDSIAYGHRVIATITVENAFVAMGSGRSLHTRVGTAAAAIAHGYDHYGQLVEYLRMNGIVPPASRH